MKQVVVIGRSRSGTSLVAGMLHLLGVNMHPNNIEHPSNPKGAFEDPRWINITGNMNLAIQTGDADLMKKYRDIAGDIIREYDAESDIWGFKSATVHQCIDHIVGQMTNPHLVYVFRNPLTTAYSDAKFTHNDSLEFTETLKEIKIATAMRQTGEFLIACELIMNKYRNIPHLFMTFLEIRDNPIKAAKRLADFIGIFEFDTTTIKDFVMPDYCTWRQK